MLSPRAALSIAPWVIGMRGIVVILESASPEDRRRVYAAAQITIVCNHENRRESELTRVGRARGCQGASPPGRHHHPGRLEDVVELRTVPAEVDGGPTLVHETTERIVDYYLYTQVVID